MTADIHDRLISDSFLLPEERQQRNSSSLRGWVAHTHTTHTRRSTKQHSSVSVYMCPSIQHTQTHVCVRPGWSLSRSFEYFTRDTTTAPPEESDAPDSPPGYPQQPVVSVQGNRVCECVGVCGGCRAEIHREASRSHQRTRAGREPTRSPRTKRLMMGNKEY